MDFFQKLRELKNSWTTLNFMENLAKNLNRELAYLWSYLRSQNNVPTWMSFSTEMQQKIFPSKCFTRSWGAFIKDVHNSSDFWYHIALLPSSANFQFWGTPEFLLLSFFCSYKYCYLLWSLSKRRYHLKSICFMSRKIQTPKS